MAASRPLPFTHDLPTLHVKLQGLLQFLRDALSISNAHTVDFYTEAVWEELVDLPPETVLAALRKSAAEADRQLSAPRPLVEAERGSGEWWAGGKEALRRVPICKVRPLVSSDRNWGRGGPPGGTQANRLE
jgi:hypothetical protein